jgi:hypothetical protein
VIPWYIENELRQTALKKHLSFMQALLAFQRVEWPLFSFLYVLIPEIFTVVKIIMNHIHGRWLLYITCCDYCWQTLYTRDSWSSFWCTKEGNLTISVFHQFFFLFKPKAENVKQQLTMGRSHMVLCTGKYMWLMFLFNFMIFIFQIFIKASYQ